MQRFIFLLLFLAIPNLGFSNVNQQVEALQQKLPKLVGEKRIPTLNKLGNLLLEDNSELARTYFKEVEEIATKLGDKEKTGEAIRNLGLIVLKTGNRAQALILLEQALTIAQENQFQSLEMTSLWSLGHYWVRLRDYPKSLELLMKSKQLAIEQQDDLWLTKCYLQFGWVYLMDGNYADSEIYFTKAMSQSEKITDHKEKIKVCHGMASFYINRNVSLHLAKTHLEQAIDIATENNDAFSAAKLEYAVGDLSSELGQKELAKSYYLSALEYFKSVKSYEDIVLLYNLLARFALNEKDYNTALGYNNSALNMLDNIDLKEDTRAKIFLSIGHIYKDRDKDYKKALEYYKRGLESTKIDGPQFPRLTIELTIGQLYLEMKEYDKAILWCERSLAIPNKPLKFSKTTCSCLANAYDKIGQTEKALEHFKELTILADSVNQEQLAIQMDNFEVQRNYEKEFAMMKQQQALENEQSKTRSAMTIGGLVLLFMTIIMSLIVINVKRTEQKNQLIALAKLRKELIANVSHDLRTPIAIMQGYIETLLMKINSTTKLDRERYLNIIMNSSERLSLLISQLFEFSKLETEEVQLQKEPFKISELLSSSLEEYQVLADKKGIQLEMDCPKNAPVIYADISLMERVIQNLMDNALKFTPEKGRIKVFVKGHPKNVEISIIDNGCGIEEEQQTKIFNRYEKIQNSKGAGLGLAIVKKILEMHKGAISVKSQLGSGTQFTLSLPTYELPSN